jgi:hypothetical protein
MENKEALDVITTLNLSGITNSICGISVGNETTLSSSSILVFLLNNSDAGQQLGK